MPRSYTPSAIGRDVVRGLTGLDYIALYVENSLEELQARNPGVESIFRRIAADELTAQIYFDGRKLSFCRVYTGGSMVGGGISIRR